MQTDLREHLSTSVRQVSMAVGDNVWRLHVYGVTRVGPALFIQTALVGPRNCTAVVRVVAGSDPRQAARQALQLIRQWLVSGDESDHAFLEPAEPALVAC
jgi:hypothetical protein